MTSERKTGVSARPGKEEPAGEGELKIEYQKAPSILWFAIPLLLLMAYGYFTR